ncbi:MAG: hypothetical protein WBG50_10945 [Desulfomonilaceae bacterium]
MGSRSIGRLILVLSLPLLLSCALSPVVCAQGLQQSPYSAPNALRGGPPGGGLGPAPSNPLRLPGSLGAPSGPESLYVSDSMLRGILPLIPNLQFGYLYDFGNNRVNSGRFTADYLLPFTLSADSEVFGEAHTEFQDFWNTLRSAFTSGTTTTYNSGFNNRVDMSFGGGFRTFLRRDALLGVNGFYDTSRLGGTWYSSGGLGFEMAALMGSDALDFNFNWYGQLFNSNVIVNAFRYGPSNFDFQAGYSHELWNGGPDLRLSATGYKFDIGNSVYGWNGGAELWSRDAMFVLRYKVGHDKVNRTYQEVGGVVNIGFQLENLFRFASPFSKPEPIFKSPRTLRYMLTQPVRRSWHESAVVVQCRSTPATCPLPGYRILCGQTLDSDVTYPVAPTPTNAFPGSVTVTIYWSGVTAPPAVVTVIAYTSPVTSGNNTFVRAVNFTASPPCGQYTFTSRAFHTSPPGFTLITATGAPITFAPGGGMSFVYH